MKGIVFKGAVSDVCAELEAEAKRCKGMTVGEYLSLRKIEKAEEEQFARIMSDIKAGGRNGR